MTDLPTEKLLGTYLKSRRTKLDPTSFGIPAGRRRTLGLRREEAAHRANISSTWYTWLEQGRGGAPSAAALDRIAGVLRLTDVEREHIFLLGLGRPPEARYQRSKCVSARLQRVLDALDPSPAVIRTATWDVIAWNRAATVVFMDYGCLPSGQRNMLRFMFLDPQARAAYDNWESIARLVVGAFRLDAARAGAGTDVEPLIEELCKLSPEFHAIWGESDVPLIHNDSAKRIHHPLLGDTKVELSAFAVDGRPDLSLLIVNPILPQDARRISNLVQQHSE